MKDRKIFSKLRIFIVCALVGIYANEPSEFVALHQKIPRVLMLVISSDGDVYDLLQQSWRSYMHSNPHIEVYFIRGNFQSRLPYAIQGDTVWAKAEESWAPGLLDKTLLALEAFLPRLDEFDYVVRTNLSSFWIFPRLLHFLSTLPKERCYCGFTGYVPPPKSSFFISGTGFILSRDMAKLLIDHKSILFNVRPWYDDVAIGDFMWSKRIPFLPAPRVEISSLEKWEECKKSIPNNQFHFRVKNGEDMRDRIRSEPVIRRELIEKFCNTPCEMPPMQVPNLYQCLSHLTSLAKQSSSAIDIGSTSAVASWTLLTQLTHPISYTHIDSHLSSQEWEMLDKFTTLYHIPFLSTLATADMALIQTSLSDPTEILLETIAPNVKTIALYIRSSLEPLTTPSESRKETLCAPLISFLQRHPEWTLSHCSYNNCAFLILNHL